MTGETFRGVCVIPEKTYIHLTAAPETLDVILLINVTTLQTQSPSEHMRIFTSF